MKRKQSIESLDVTKSYNCGRKSIYHAEHLSLRTEAKAGDWPWHVAIFYKKGSEVIYQCGGSIVSSTAILTAAHCIVAGIPEKDYIVVAGIGSTNITHRDLDMLKLSVRKIVIHPKYKEMYSTADLAIIKVKTIAFTVHVQPVCIWGPGGNRKDLFGTEAVIVGFGENEHGTLNKDLRAINIMVQEDRTCGSLKELLGKYTFCAGNGPDSTFVNFERVNVSKWTGNIYFALYPNLKEVLLKIHFGKDVTITPTFNNRSISLKSDKRTLELHTKRPIPKLYTFNVFTNSRNASQIDVPEVHNLTLNNEILCNSIKRNQSLQSLNITKGSNDNGNAYTCGRRSIKHAEIVSLRTEAKAGDWPWHVAVYVKLNGTVFYQCGGSIVSRNAVLTAAHCIVAGIPIEDYLVVAGISRVNITGYEYYTMQNLTVQDIIVHKKYKPMRSTADLAIIKVNTIQFTDYVRPVCIWPSYTNRTDLFGIEATIVGFGKNERKILNSYLRAIQITVQRDTVCTSLSKLLNNYTFCAGNGPNTITNVSNGDSGGGLVVRTSQPDHGITWFIRGVLSKCGKMSVGIICDPKEYAIFTNVAAHYDWIYQNSGIASASNTSA
uniref:Peptidase S1 domain-containing protein n=1 Tax=Heliothis virescens TaxID=7102 RepID=A0A2A4JF07_HELVI